MKDRTEDEELISRTRSNIAKTKKLIRQTKELVRQTRLLLAPRITVRKKSAN
jgi:hypothetical protein